MTAMTIDGVSELDVQVSSDSRVGKKVAMALRADGTIFLGYGSLCRFESLVLDVQDLRALRDWATEQLHKKAEALVESIDRAG